MMKPWVKHISLYVFLLMLVVSLFSSVALANEPTYEFEGKGTQEEPFALSSLDDLLKLSSLINQETPLDDQDDLLYSQVYYQLTQSIDMSNTNWVSIGNQNTPFFGTLSGNGHRLYNLNLTGSTGLFGALSGASITNVVLEDITLSSPIDDDLSLLNIGVLFATATNSSINNITIRNANITLNFTQNDQLYRIGGIGGLVRSSVMNTISFLGTININSTNLLDTSRLMAGFIVGEATNTTFNNTSTSTSTLNVSAIFDQGQVGGFMGYGNTVTITNSQSRGIINVDNQNNMFVGGFIGDAHSINIRESISSGNINLSSQRGHVGSFIGRLQDEREQPTITNSYSRHALSVSLFREGFIGGLIGEIIGLSSLLDHVYFAGSISTTNNEALIDPIGVIDDDSIIDQPSSRYYDQTRLNGLISTLGQGVSTQQLKRQETLASFDFEQVWVISNSNNDGYPTLRYGRFLVQFDPDNDTQRLDQLVRSATAPSNPTKSGYSFLFWSNDNGESAFNFNAPLTQDVLLRAYYISDIVVIINDNSPLQLKVENLDQAIEFTASERQNPVAIQLEFRIGSITSINQEARDAINDYMVDTYQEAVSAMMFFDITLLKMVGNQQTLISEANTDVTLSFIVPTRYRRATFSLIHVHENQIEELDYDYDATTNTIEFVTNKFSTFSFVTTAPFSTISEPNTTSNTQQDYSWLYGWIFLVLGLLLILSTSIRTIDD